MSGHYVSVICSAVLLTIQATSATARSWSVAPDGSGDFTRVSDALAATSDGDSILIEPGTYDEYDGVDTWIVVEEKSLALLGRGVRPEDTALRLNIFFETCEEVVCEDLLFHHDEQPLRSYHGNLTVRNCRFEDNLSPTYPRPGAAIQNNAGSLIVVDSDFIRNRTDNFGWDYEMASGGAIHTDGPAEIHGCIFVDNEASGLGGAVWGGGDIVIEDCVFFRNRARKGAGIYLGGAPHVRRCTFLANEIIEGDGACVEGWSDWLLYDMFTHCIVAKTINGWGVECNYAKNLECIDLWMNERGSIFGFWCTDTIEHGNFTADPLFCDEETGDVGLLEGSPCLAENSPEQCGQIGARGIGCGGSPTEEVTFGRIKALFR